MTAALLMAASLTACSSSSSSTAASSTASAAAEATAEATESASAESETTAAKYTITNNTGEKVTELYVYVDGEDKGDNYAADGLDDGAEVVVDKGDQPSDQNYTLEYVTESGRDASFTTLHMEEANLSLLAEDAMTGSTPLEFVTE